MSSQQQKKRLVGSTHEVLSFTEMRKITGSNPILTLLKQLLRLTMIRNKIQLWIKRAAHLCSKLFEKIILLVGAYNLSPIFFLLILAYVFLIKVLSSSSSHVLPVSRKFKRRNSIVYPFELNRKIKDTIRNTLGYTKEINIFFMFLFHCEKK